MFFFNQASCWNFDVIFASTETIRHSFHCAVPWYLWLRPWVNLCVESFFFSCLLVCMFTPRGTDALLGFLLEAAEASSDSLFPSDASNVPGGNHNVSPCVFPWLSKSTVRLLLVGLKIWNLKGKGVLRTQDSEFSQSEGSQILLG